MKMVYRNPEGELRIKYLEFMPLIDEMFDECENIDECYYISNEIIEVVEGIREGFVGNFVGIQEEF